MDATVSTLYFTLVENVFSHTPLAFHHLAPRDGSRIVTTHGPHNDLFDKTCTRAMGDIQLQGDDTLAGRKLNDDQRRTHKLSHSKKRGGIAQQAAEPKQDLRPPPPHTLSGAPRGGCGEGRPYL